MFELKPISRNAIPEALAKVERYRLLNEPWQAESIKRLGLSGENTTCLHLPTTFPNCQFAITPAWCQTLIAWPMGPQKTRVSFEFYAHKWSGSNHDLADVIKWFDFVNRQDWGICELQQAGFSSGVFNGGRFNELERVVHHFQRLYAQAMGGEHG